MTAPTKKEVEAMAVALIASINTGGFSEADAKKLTTGQYLTRWVESINQNVRPSTQRRYSDLIRKHIEPEIGRVQLAKLSALDIQRLYADRLDAGLSPTTVELLHCILHGALKQAVRWGLITRNVVEMVDAPRRKTPEYITWDQQQASAFLAVADKDDLAALWRLALHTGMRRGEILGLLWADLDLARGALSVKRTLSRGPGNSFEVGQPKTKHGRRQIELPKSVVQALQKHRKRQVEERLQLGSDYQDGGLVFADALGGPVHPNTLRRHFIRLIKVAGVPMIRFHDLRHTSATLMLSGGEHPKIVSEMLGHANIGITLDRYSHVTPSMQRNAVDRLDDMLGGQAAGAR